MKIKVKYFDPTDASTLINKSTGKHLIDGLSVVPIYKGKTYSINDVVNKDGTVNVKKAKKIMEEVAEYFGGKKMQNRPENPVWHKDDPNTWLHTKKVAKNAWAIPVPEGYTKQDQMIAALGHDFGKMLSGDGHAEVSYNLIKQIFPDATSKQLEAMRKHMNELGSHEDLLEQATKFADLGVTPGADLTQIGLTPEELEIVKQTKWFKEGGNVQYFDKGGAVYKLLNELYHKVNKGIPLADWSPEQWDEVYNYVLKRYGEKESNVLQRIRDYHFWAKAPNTKLREVSGKPIEVVHHTNSEPFSIFDINKAGSTDVGHRGKGFYFDSTDTFNTTSYGPNSISAYLNITNPEKGNQFVDFIDAPGYIFSLGRGTRKELIAQRINSNSNNLLEITENFIKSKETGKSIEIPKELKNLGITKDTPEEVILEKVNKKLEPIIEEAEEYFPKYFDKIDGYMDEYENVVYSPKQIKSSKAITRDPLGNIIPISRRDNFTHQSIMYKDGGTLVPKNISGGTLETLVKALRDGFGGKKAVQKLAGQTGYGTDKKFLEAAAESYEKVCANLGGSVEEVMELYPMEELMEDVVKNMKAPEVTTKAAKGDYKKATVFAPKDADFTGTSLFGDSVDISKDIKELTKNGINETNKVSSNKPIREALNSQQIGFKSQPVSYSPSMEARESGYMGSKGSQVPVSVIRDAEVDEFKKQILVPTATERGASLDQAAYLTNHGTSGIIEKPTSSNLEQNLSTYADGYARLNASTVFNQKSGSRIKSLLIHENLGHGLEGFLSKDYLDSFKGLPGLDKLGERDAADVRAMLMEAKFFLWKQAKKVSGKDVISPAELNEFISKVPDSQLQELLATLNHQGVGAKGTGTTIAQKFTQNPRQYKDMLGKMLGVGAVVGTGAAIAANSIPEAKQGMKFQEGGMIEEKPFYEQIAELPVYRHLWNQTTAEEFDADLNDLLSRKEINYGELSEDAEIELQKKYNLNYTQLKETLDDLYNAGLGQALIKDLIKSPEIVEFQEGGSLIPKYSLGSWIGKAFKNNPEISKPILETTENIGRKAAKELAYDGTTATFSKEAIKVLQELGETDKECKLLADIASNENVKFPKTFVLFVESSLKHETLNSKRITKTTYEDTLKLPKLQHEGTAAERLSTKQKSFKVPKNKEVTDEFKVSESYKMRAPETVQEKAEFKQDVKQALKYVEDMYYGKYQIDQPMVEKILLKNKGAFDTFENAEEISRLDRFQFNYSEVPQMAKHQMIHGFDSTRTEVDPRVRENIKQNISRLRYSYRKGLVEKLNRDAERYADTLIRKYPNKYSVTSREQLVQDYIEKRKYNLFHPLAGVNTYEDVHIKPVIARTSKKYIPVKAETTGFILPNLGLQSNSGNNIIHWEQIDSNKFIPGYNFVDDRGYKIGALPSNIDWHHSERPLAIGESLAFINNTADKTPMHITQFIQELNRGKGSAAQKEKALAQYLSGFDPLNRDAHNLAHSLMRLSKQDLAQLKIITSYGIFSPKKDETIFDALEAATQFLENIKTQRKTRWDKLKSEKLPQILETNESIVKEKPLAGTVIDLTKSRQKIWTNYKKQRDKVLQLHSKGTGLPEDVVAKELGINMDISKDLIDYYRNKLSKPRQLIKTLEEQVAIREVPNHPWRRELPKYRRSLERAKESYKKLVLQTLPGNSSTDQQLREILMYGIPMAE